MTAGETSSSVNSSATSGMREKRAFGSGESMKGERQLASQQPTTPAPEARFFFVRLEEGLQ
jgi:hypothetical protein